MSRRRRIIKGATNISNEDLCVDVDAGLGLHEEWCGRSVEEGVGLAVHVGLLHAVAQLLQVELGLHVHVLSTL